MNCWIVNGTNHTEATNGFKDEMFGFVLTSSKTFTWTVNYHLGQEHPDAVTSSCGPMPVQPGLCFQPVNPAPDRKLHIFDSYAHGRLCRSGRLPLRPITSSSICGRRQDRADRPPHRMSIAALCMPGINSIRRSLWRPVQNTFPLAVDYSAVSPEALKETTITADYKVADGFLMHGEWRRDFSNQSIFPTAHADAFKEQNTASLGLIWWFGRKQGAW